jgi:surface protein
MDNIFYGCHSLLSLPDISKWNTSNIIYMDNIFYGCHSLFSLPDIYKWNTSNVKNMNNIFSRCHSLVSLPDISKWDTSNVEFMNNIFSGCHSLISLPDISKWDISNVKEINNIFYKSKFSLTLNVYSKNNIFFEVIYKNHKSSKNRVRILNRKFISKNSDKSGIILNDFKFELKEYFDEIDKNQYDIIKILLYMNKNIDDVSYLFSGCESLISINRIYNIYHYIWNYQLNKINEELLLKFNNSTNIKDDNILDNSINFYEDFDHISSQISTINKVVTNQEDTKFDFSVCGQQSSYPEISYVNISKVKDMSYMFEGCKSLISLPDIFDWDTTNVNNV